MKRATLLGCVVGLGAGICAWAGCGDGGGEQFAPVVVGDAGQDSGAANADAAPGCGIQSTAVHGLTPDGRVNVSAAEAWPSRPAEPAPLTSSERLGVCAINSACFAQIGDAGVSSDAAQIKAIADCLDPKIYSWEERAVPDFDQNERWSFKARSMLAKGGCAGVLTGSKRASGIYCEETGCRWKGSTPATVTCEGTVASIAAADGTVTRDCAGSYATCSTTSGTGCTDRPLVACDRAAKDRCDGDVKLGCDGCGLVSFHDCSLLGGHCMESPDGKAACVYSDPASCTTMPSCTGSTLTFCSGGAPATVDCAQLGLSGCSNGHCTK
jgi:hypothetical protein